MQQLGGTLFSAEEVAEGLSIIMAKAQGKFASLGSRVSMDLDDMMRRRIKFAIDERIREALRAAAALLQRDSLTPGQRSMLALELQPFYAEAAKERQRLKGRGKNGSGEPRHRFWVKEYLARERYLAKVLAALSASEAAREQLKADLCRTCLVASGVLALAMEAQQWAAKDA